MRASDFGKAVNFNADVSLAESECAWLDDVHFYRVIPLLKDGFDQKQEKDRFFAAGKLCHPRLFRQSGGMDLCKKHPGVF
jgi:hypothetical protein